MNTISPADFLKLQNEVAYLQKEFAELIKAYPTRIDIKTIALDLNIPTSTLSRYLKRHTSELGIGTTFKDDEFEVICGTLFLCKSAVFKLKEIYA